LGEPGWSILRECRSLSAKESFGREIQHLVQVQEDDSLAMYLHAGRQFPATPPAVLSVPDELWEEFKRKPEFIAKKEADKLSYCWDELVDVLTGDLLGANLEPGYSPSDKELVLRVMAREHRFSRRLLGTAFKESSSKNLDQPL